MTRNQFYRVCNSDQLSYGKSHNYDRNSIRMAVVKKNAIYWLLLLLELL